MGDLADRLLQLQADIAAPEAWRSADCAERANAIASDISDLEHRHALALAELERMREVSKRRIAELDAKLAEAVRDTEHPLIIPDLHDSGVVWQEIALEHKRRADAAMMAATHIIKRDMRIVELQKLKDSTRVDDIVELRLGSSRNFDDVHIAILVPGSKPNPDLLERASTLLAEAYIEAKKAEGK